MWRHIQTAATKELFRSWIMHSIHDPSQRVTRAVVDLGAIAHNVRLLRERADPAAALMAVVKANAYGHGAVPVARPACRPARRGWPWPWWTRGWRCAVPASRRRSWSWVGRRPRSTPRLCATTLTLAVGSLDMAHALAATARGLGVAARVHAKVDTGLSRFGIPAARAVDEIVALSPRSPASRSTASTRTSSPRKRPTRARHARAVGPLHRRAGGPGGARGAGSDSATPPTAARILDLPETHLDLVRAGIALYGYHPAGRPRAMGTAAACARP